MGRPAKFDRNEAVELTMNEIWRHGFEACSTKSISEKLGITRSSFYNAFGSREALFLEALELYFVGAPDNALHTITDDANVLQALTRLCAEICRVRASDPESRGCLAVNAVTELVGVNENIGPILAEAVRVNLARIEQLLHKAVDNGELKDTGDLKVRAIAYKNLLVGINVMSKVVSDEQQLWDVAKQTLKGLGLYAELPAPT